MKILIINPNSDAETDERLRKKAAAFVRGAYQVDVTHVAATPKLMATQEDAAKGLPEMMELIQRGEEYDAFIVACHSDPNLEVLQAITDKPVVGIAEASMKIASMNCHSFAVISPSARSISPKRALARKYLCQDLYRGAEVCPENDSENLCRAAERAVEHSHVDGIVLGCANYANADAYIERKLGVKVFDGVACALMLAAGLAMYRRYRNEWKEGEEH